MDTSDAFACPACAAPFAAESRAAYDLHVRDCSASLPAASSSARAAATAAHAVSSPSSSVVVDAGGVTHANASSSDSVTTAHVKESCARCQYVFMNGAAAHVVAFHEFECVRVSKRKGGAQGKRLREAVASTVTTTTVSTSASTESMDVDADADMQSAPVQKKVTLFPTQCALCGSGGRALLRCGGSCARVFHAACVDEVQPGNSSRAIASTSSAAGLSLQSEWTCAECARGVHVCQLCGFLGHESNTMLRCAVVDCGFFFHVKCLPARPQEAEEEKYELVCPRHTCSICGAEERDMRKCLSCTKCFAASHLKCPTQTTSSNTSVSTGSDTPYLHICGAHKSTSTTTSANRRPDAVEMTLALKYRVQQGDIVLLLELGNAILPPSAKDAAPDACNQWGVVTRAETLEGRDQLLYISIFSDGSVIAVPNKYVLPLGSANAFTTPQGMLRDCIKWHAVTELNLRHKELDAAAAVIKDEVKKCILEMSWSTFDARAQELSLSAVEIISAAEEGYIFWKTHRAELKQFEGSGAPIYVFMDTRSSVEDSNAEVEVVQVGAGEQLKSSSTSAHADDVNMEEDATKTDESTAGSTSLQQRWLQGQLTAKPQAPESEAAKLQPRERKADSALVAMPGDASTVELPGSVSNSTSLEATFVDAVEVTLVASAEAEDADVVQREDDRESTSSLHDAKRQKLSHDHSQQQAKTAQSFTFETPSQFAKPLAPSSNTFVREKASFTASQNAMKLKQTRRERVLAEYSPQMLQELEHQAAKFLEDEASPAVRARRSRKPSNPKHSDAFPFASAPESFRPPYFRPSVVFSRARGRRMEGLSRILLSQDKRNIKCFIQGTDENRCLHQPSRTGSVNGAQQVTTRAKGSFVTIDLMSVDSFRALEMVIRTRMVAAVEQNDGYLQEIFEDHADRARRLFTEKKNSGLTMHLYYCSYDGSREKVVRESDDWLCFCANVCHLTAVIPLQAEGGGGDANQ